VVTEDLLTLPTPCALVDRERVERNCRAMAAAARRWGVRLRPHVKTHKCVEAARLQVAEAPEGGITVSTLAEARHFAAAGFRDITYAVPIAPERLPEAVEIGRGIDRLSVLVDGPVAVAAAAEVAAAADARIPLFLKVDCGYGRAGVDPARPESVALARSVAASPHLDFRGLLTHGGHSYGAHSPAESLGAALEEAASPVAFARKLREEGVEVPEVSVGSTPTCTALTREVAAAGGDGVGVWDGVTEIRPGNYVFFDVYQTLLGSCQLEDVAFSVLVTVISHHPHRNRLLVNAGSLALSADPGPRHVDPHCGFGLVADLAGQPLAGLRLTGLSQEHGWVEAASGDGRELEVFPVGTRLRIFPNHSCLTAAAYDRYHVLEGGQRVDEWRPVRGW
jgi:D-serine deaminase-like pyridoxal phosphate-dependent protein